MTASGVIDLTKYVCPLTYVLVKAHVEDIQIGKVVEVEIQGQNTLLDVSRTLKLDGYTVTKVSPQDKEIYRLSILRT